MCICIDGILALDAGCLTSSLTFEEQQRLKAIVLTHGHYDHVRDIPAIGMNFYLHKNRIDIYGIPPVFETLESHFMYDTVYPDYFNRPAEQPTFTRNTLEPGKEVRVGDYTLLPVEMIHSIPLTGIQVTASEGKRVFYTSDTGPGIGERWDMVDPDLLIIEVTGPNRYDRVAHEAGHLTPELLGNELADFRKRKGYLPQVVTVHMNPLDETDIRKELEAVSGELGIDIKVGYEGMQLTV